MKKKSSKSQMTNAERAKRMSQRIALQVARGAGKGLDAARIFLTARIKEELSVPAPRRRVMSMRLRKAKGKTKVSGAIGKVLGAMGDIYYVATTKAIPGAPPRKLSGRMRSSVISVMVTDKTAVVGLNAKARPSKRFPGGFPYPRYHEIKDGNFRGSGKHRYMVPTFLKWRVQIALIIGSAVASVVNAGDIQEARYV